MATGRVGGLLSRRCCKRLAFRSTRNAWFRTLLSRGGSKWREMGCAMLVRRIGRRFSSVEPNQLPAFSHVYDSVSSRVLRPFFQGRGGMFVHNTYAAANVSKRLFCSAHMGGWRTPSQDPLAATAGTGSRESSSRTTRSNNLSPTTGLLFSPRLRSSLGHLHRKDSSVTEPHRADCAYPRPRRLLEAVRIRSSCPCPRPPAGRSAGPF